MTSTRYDISVVQHKVMGHLSQNKLKWALCSVV